MRSFLRLSGLCRQSRDNPDNQERASTHTVMKCMRCMTACDKKRIKERLKDENNT